MDVKTLFRKAINQLAFKTKKELKIYDWRLFVLHGGLCLMIAGAILYNDIWKAKGYQQSDPLIGVVQPRIRGVARANGGAVWDVWDAVVPSKEKGAMFITTNYNVEEKQKRGVCTGSDLKTEVSVKGSCVPGKPSRFGFLTGKRGQEKDGNDFCEVEGWCPTPSINTPQTGQILDEVSNWELVMTTNVKFPKFDVSVSTAPTGPNATQEGYNSFKIADILKRANTSWDDVKSGGSVILVQVTFDCNLDVSLDKCKPTYRFVRVDDSEEPGISSGFSFRNARYFYSQSEELRDLWQLYGIRLVFDVGGYGRKFNANVVAQKFGASAALIAVAILMVDKLCEVVFPVIFHQYEWFKDVKFQHVDKEGHSFKWEVNPPL